jgi:subtilisin family serine protease
VAAVRADGAWIGSSSQGPGPAPARLLKPDISAPSHFRDADDAARLNTGTSTASAVTAGAIAALRQGWPALPPAAMKQLLIDTARVADGGPGWSDRTGHGIIDLQAAVDALGALP